MEQNAEYLWACSVVWYVPLLKIKKFIHPIGTSTCTTRNKCFVNYVLLICTECSFWFLQGDCEALCWEVPWEDSLHQPLLLTAHHDTGTRVMLWCMSNCHYNDNSWAGQYHVVHLYISVHACVYRLQFAWTSYENWVFKSLYKYIRITYMFEKLYN